jgi:uncharacterized protein with PQ loop repeat
MSSVRVKNYIYQINLVIIKYKDTSCIWVYCVVFSKIALFKWNIIVIIYNKCSSLLKSSVRVKNYIDQINLIIIRYKETSSIWAVCFIFSKIALFQWNIIVIIYNKCSSLLMSSVRVKNYIYQINLVIIRYKETSSIWVYCVVFSKIALFKWNIIVIIYNKCSSLLKSTVRVKNYIDQINLVIIKYKETSSIWVYCVVFSKIALFQWNIIVNLYNKCSS